MIIVTPFSVLPSLKNFTLRSINSLTPKWNKESLQMKLLSFNWKFNSKLPSNNNWYSNQHNNSSRPIRLRLLKVRKELRCSIRSQNLWLSTKLLTPMSLETMMWSTVVLNIELLKDNWSPLMKEENLNRLRLKIYLFNNRLLRSKRLLSLLLKIFMKNIMDRIERINELNQ